MTDEHASIARASDARRPGSARPGGRRHANGLGTLRSQIKIVAKLETDCAQDKGLLGGSGHPTPGRTSRRSTGRAVRRSSAPSRRSRTPASGRRGPRSAPTRCRTSSRRSRPVGRPRASAQFPAEIGQLGVETLYQAVMGKNVSAKVSASTPARARARLERRGPGAAAAPPSAFGASRLLPGSDSPVASERRLRARLAGDHRRDRTGCRRRDRADPDADRDDPVSARRMTPLAGPRCSVALARDLT